MLEILGANYYIDLDAAIEVCRPTYANKEVVSEPEQKVEPEKAESLTETGDRPAPEPTSGAGEINIFKFEVVKACIERTFGEYMDPDDGLDAFVGKPLSPSFKIAFNTLLKYEILKEEDDE